MNLDEIKKIIRIFEKSEIGELEIEEDNYKIRLRKSNNLPVQNPNLNGNSNTYIIPSPGSVPTAEGTNPVNSKSTAQDSSPETIDEKNNNYYEVRSPIVGTFYRAPSPEEPPFTEVGSVVAKGETLCIIEAMKLMNEIQSELGGKVAEILVENAQPVEYNQLLFLIEKSGE
jgi:acetyl-CoA carboxylase biotin carboxyl carrier protein